MGLKDSLKDKKGKLMASVGASVESTKRHMDMLAVSVETTINPNHRHDEKHEQEQDRIRQEICDSHRYQSFANIRAGNSVKWYSDGHDYFWALSEILDGAKECIYVSVYSGEIWRQRGEFLLLK
jgi:phospholipase D1/2